ncbi:MULTISPECIES: site-specific integrase [Bacillus cereus group]|uniref:Tyrosine-type recombinase/integrase n=3 Tax=Bacillus cereus group TaxID=86661 RepID=A0AAW7NL36_BACCE|nr:MULTISPECIES: site-specific integrase [Bacillus cereus group]AZR79056.1 site-specific integrase [Bacillus thuringiensis]MBG9520738.1 integrase [Bacillus thuringiensis]MDA2087600.1 tyrosine-type recombinase/integrase [Bacillus cereus]MDD9277094.1 tyrosine-type recombinase/integrase [Bacillus thuringiensis]MDN4875709.1 tyrosine-type recombinase/integrase [Bacillus cereus]
MATFRKRGKKWEYRIRYVDKTTGKKREISKGGFDSKKEATFHANERERQLFHGMAADSKKTLLSEYLIEWLETYKKGKVGQSTYLLNKRNINQHIIPYFQNIKLADMNKIEYQKFINHLINKGYSKRTVEIINSTMSNAIKRAIDLEMVYKDFTNRILIAADRFNQHSKKENYLTKEQVSKLLNAAHKDKILYYTLIYTLVESGMRKGEATALEWDTNIDLDNKMIHIDRTINYHAYTPTGQKNSKDLIGKTKTYDSVRSITISDRLVSVLKTFKTYQNECKLKLGAKYDKTFDFVFTTTGKPIPHSTLKNVLDRILKNAEVPKIPVHGLRHTHAVLLLEAGVEMKYIQERLGHKSIEITSNIYSHVTPKIIENEQSKYEAYVGREFVF